MQVKSSKRGYKCKPTRRKIKEWRKMIEMALHEDRLAPGMASKLAGKLAWGASNLFRCVLSVVRCGVSWHCSGHPFARKLGRAMLRPIFDQKSRRDGKMSPELRRALVWWLQILRADLC